MLYGFLVTILIVLSFLMVISILVQKGKGSSGMGNFGGSAQQFFGGSGGADFLQKLTWGMGFLFMAITLILALLQVRSLKVSKYSYGSVSGSVSKNSAEKSLEEVPVEMPMNE